MATNPMQRRARNSFLIGFLVALLIMAVVVVFLVYRMQSLNADYEDLKALQKKVYVAREDIQSGTEVTLDSFTYDTVQTSLADDELIESQDFQFIDEQSGEIIEKYDSDGNPKQKKMVVKTNVPAGTILTKDMLEEEDNLLTADQRIQEYNMIILPTLLKNGEYIDIRLQLPGGEDYIVVAKKQVIYTNESSIWIKLSEEEILTLGNSIVEAYTIVGSKLYATTYPEAGRQKAATPTYAASNAVMSLINTNPNVREEAKNGLWQRYQSDYRNNHINEALEPYYNGMKEAVEAGLQEEITKLKEGRQNYVESLEGTGMVGTE